MNIISEIKKELVKALSLMKADNIELAATNITKDQVKISGDIAVGTKVEKVNADGSLSPLEDGDYNLDGNEFTVKSGVIDSIVGQDKADAGNETPAEDATEGSIGGDSANAAPVEDETEDDSEISNVQAQIDELKSEIETLKSSMADMMKSFQGMSQVATKGDVEKFKTEVENLNSTITKLAKIPVELSKTNQSNVVKDKTEEKLFDFIKAMSNK
jgi:uncharacterized protein YukE